MAWRKPIPILSEAQREAIRRGEYPSLRAKAGPEELARSRAAHEERIARRAEEAGLPINPRELLNAIPERPEDEKREAAWDWFINHWIE